MGVFLVPLSGEAAPVELGSQSLDFVPRSSISYFQETGEELTFEEVSTPTFQSQFTEGVGVLGSSFMCPGSIWMKFEFVNRNGWENVNVRGNYSMTKYDFYSSSAGYLGTSGDFPKLHSGQRLLRSPEVKVPLDPGLNTVYLRAECEIFMASILQYRDEQTNLFYVFFRDYLVIVSTIVTILVGGFSFFVGFIGRNPLFLAYSGYVFSSFLISASYLWALPKVFDELWLSSLNVTLLGSIGVTVSLTLFFNYLFNLKRYKIFRIIVNIVVISHFPLFILNLIKPEVLPILISQSILMAIAGGVIVWQSFKKNPIAILLVISGLPFMLLAQVSIGYVLGLTEASVFHAYLLPNAFLYETLTFSILVGFHYFIERRESEKIEKEVQRDRHKFAFQGLITADFSQLTEENKKVAKGYLDDCVASWVFTYNIKGKIFCAYADLDQSSLQEMLACTFLSGVLRSHLFFHRKESEQDLLKTMKLIIKRFYKTDSSQSQFDAFCIPSKIG